MDNRLYEIFQKILKATKQGKVIWKVDKDDHDCFHTKIDSHQIILQKNPSTDQSVFQFSILNHDGILLEKIIFNHIILRI